MADPSGFLKYQRQTPHRRPVPLRLRDWNEVYEPFDKDATRAQAARCMDCGIPFCHQGCPLGNIIPEWNELVRLDRWEEASDRLHATNNFPEFTGRLCPAPCEGSCVLGIGDDPVAIKLVEQEIADRAIASGQALIPHPAEIRTGRKVAVVGSGPAGLAAAQQLARAGHDVTVFERDVRIGGLMRYGIPEFKMDRDVLDARLEQMRAEGVEFVTGVQRRCVGSDVTVEQLRERFDAVVIATGSTVPREIDVDGRHLDGHPPGDGLPGPGEQGARGHPGRGRPSTPRARTSSSSAAATPAPTATAPRCGRARLGAPAGHPRRAAGDPGPVHPVAGLPADAADLGRPRGGRRARSSASTRRPSRPTEDGKVAGIHLVEGKRIPGGFIPTEGTDTFVKADLVLIALGFAGPETPGLLDGLGVEITNRGTIERDDNYMTSVDGVFVAGDAGRGQSLIVWAIAEGRSAAAGVDAYLMGSSLLPDPVEPTAVALR